MKSVKHGASEETDVILQSLKAFDVDFAKIIAVVFDTTALNSGLNNGVVVQLQKELKHEVLQLACRHHILELVCGAPCTLVYGDTESPDEAKYKQFAEVWSSLDKTNYAVFSTKSRSLLKTKDLVLNFLEDWMLNGESLREDYLEIVQVSFLFLGGIIPKDITFTLKDPGASHHARWMAVCIYTITMALLHKRS